MRSADTQLTQMKLEIAAEFGIHDYDSIDKGELSSRTNGRIGGEMTKRLIALGKQQLMKQLEPERELVPILIKREQQQQKLLALPLPEMYKYH